MSRWTRQRAVTLAPAEGTILPGVPLPGAPTAVADLPVTTKPRDPRSGDVNELEALAARVSERPPVAIVAPDQESPRKAESATRDRVPEAEVPRAITRKAVRPRTPRTQSVLASGPWPHPDSSAWPTTRPSWGAPPKDFGLAGGGARARLVFSDGSSTAVDGPDAQPLVEVARSLGA